MDFYQILSIIISFNKRTIHEFLQHFSEEMDLIYQQTLMEC